MAGEGFTVEVRRPLHRAAPHRRLRQRVRDRRAQRRERTSEGSADASSWWNTLDLPTGDDPVSAVITVIVFAIAAVLFVVFVGPWIWLLLLFLVELLIWVVLALAGLAAWLLLRKPWQVAVVDESTGETVATQIVDGRRRAREHASVVERRIAGGMRPDVAVTGH